MARRPLPIPTELTREYWEAAHHGRLLYARCEICGQAQFPREIACVRCQSPEVRWVPASGRGTVCSYTVIHREAFPDFPVPVVMAIVELEEGCAMFSGIVDYAYDDLCCDMTVEVTFERESDEITLPMFRPRTT